jgi:hypothetical protein
MSRKIYKSAMGKSVDLGALLLQNEQIRAVGNMNVNARGDLLDSSNTVIDSKNRQVQRQYRRQSNVTATPVASSMRDVKARANENLVDPKDTFEDLLREEVAEEIPTVTDEPDLDHAETRGGLAAAIARSREIKQELDKTRRQVQQQQSIKKI